MSDDDAPFRKCDRCHYKDYPESPAAPEYHPPTESTLCPTCRERVGEEMQGDGNA